MGRRGKVILERIKDDNSRKGCFTKRKRGFLKKAEELATICDVELASIIYSPDEAEPTVWPSPELVRATIERFQQVPVAERNARALNQQTFLAERVAKNNEQLKQLENRKKEQDIQLLLSSLYQGQRGLGDLSFEQVRGIKEYVARRIEILLDVIPQLEAKAEARASGAGPSGTAGDGGGYDVAGGYEMAAGQGGGAGPSYTTGGYVGQTAKGYDMAGVQGCGAGPSDTTGGYVRQMAGGYDMAGVQGGGAGPSDIAGGYVGQMAGGYDMAGVQVGGSCPSDTPGGYVGQMAKGYDMAGVQVGGAGPSDIAGGYVGQMAVEGGAAAAAAFFDDFELPEDLNAAMPHFFP